MGTQATAPRVIGSGTGKAKYRVTNWAEYDRALVQSGITLGIKSGKMKDSISSGCGGKCHR